MSLKITKPYNAPRKEHDEQICGTCRIHWCDVQSEEWYCANHKSENSNEFTEYSDTCEDWEGK
jgi:hypothetical protein